jgi:hypothetical protein
MQKLPTSELRGYLTDEKLASSCEQIIAVSKGKDIF